MAESAEKSIFKISAVKISSDLWQNQIYMPETEKTRNMSKKPTKLVAMHVVESTLVKLVRNQAEMLVTAENILKQKKADKSSRFIWRSVSILCELDS